MEKRIDRKIFSRYFPLDELSISVLELWPMNTITANERRSLADQVGINEQYLYQCLTGRRDMSAPEAVRLEQETNGRLDRKMVCQGTWRLIWPELLKEQA
jgi:hypothetical protein